MWRRVLLGLGLGVAIVAVWLAVLDLPRWLAPTAAAPPPAAAMPSAETNVSPRIKARLFYVTEDGQRLQGLERDVPYSNQSAEQARAILEAQLAPATAPLMTAIPPNTRLRAVYLTPEKEAYIDLSQDIATAHPGGLVNELLTVYTIVNALAVNLPAVERVQILVDGKEVDTLAGHVDLRRPLPKQLELIATPPPGDTP
jgi:spore germination protein GerM